jgi:hypothetical protein
MFSTYISFITTMSTTSPISANRTQEVQGHDVGTAHTGAANTDTDAKETQDATGITPESLKSALEKELQASFVQIEDMSGEFRIHSLLLLLREWVGCGVCLLCFALERTCS